jgi:hypothetical protein
LFAVLRIQQVPTAPGSTGHHSTSDKGKDSDDTSGVLDWQEVLHCWALFAGSFAGIAAPPLTGAAADTPDATPASPSCPTGAPGSTKGNNAAGGGGFGDDGKKRSPLQSSGSTNNPSTDAVSASSSLGELTLIDKLRCESINTPAFSTFLAFLFRISLVIRYPFWLFIPLLLHPQF